MTVFDSPVSISTESDLAEYANVVAKQICLGQIIGLNGAMGAGKTTFVRYLAAALGSSDWVNSPTYSVIQQYDIDGGRILHVDLYRCVSEQDIDQLDLLSYCDDQSIVIIEWLGRTTCIEPDILFHFHYIDQASRSIDVKIIK
jgi:tRNA threonylcarbamoyladenosine biosynthesis protein TsaE